MAAYALTLPAADPSATSRHIEWQVRGSGQSFTHDLPLEATEYLFELPVGGHLQAVIKETRPVEALTKDGWPRGTKQVTVHTIHWRIGSPVPVPGEFCLAATAASEAIHDAPAEAKRRKRSDPAAGEDTPQ